MSGNNIDGFIVTVYNDGIPAIMQYEPKSDTSGDSGNSDDTADTADSNNDDSADDDNGDTQQ